MRDACHVECGGVWGRMLSRGRVFRAAARAVLYSVSVAARGGPFVKLTPLHNL